MKESVFIFIEKKQQNVCFPTLKLPASIVYKHWPDTREFYYTDCWIV